MASDGSRKWLQLILKSPSPGAESAVYHWPLVITDERNEAAEILETIRFVCEEVPQLKQQINDIIIESDVDFTRYETIKGLCDRYNKVVNSIIHSRLVCTSQEESSQAKSRPSSLLLKHILQQCYNRAIVDPEKLNQYEPFSPEVYGETSFELIDQMINTIDFRHVDRFIDLGSGVGQVVLHIAAATGCQFSYGIEKADWPAEYAKGMVEEFERWMKFYGKVGGSYKLEKGNFLDEKYRETINSATIIFVNNFAFGPQVDHQLKLRFATMKEGAKIVSSKTFCPMSIQISARNLSDIGAIMSVTELSPLRGPVSWTGKTVNYYLHVIDRTSLEAYFLQQKIKARTVAKRRMNAKRRRQETDGLAYDESELNRSRRRDRKTNTKSYSDKNKLSAMKTKLKIFNTTVDGLDYFHQQILHVTSKEGYNSTEAFNDNIMNRYLRHFSFPPRPVQFQHYYNRPGSESPMSDVMVGKTSFVSSIFSEKLHDITDSSMKDTPNADNAFLASDSHTDQLNEMLSTPRKGREYSLCKDENTPPGLIQLLDAMKQQYKTVIEQMKSQRYAGEIRAQIAKERMHNATLWKCKKKLEQDVNDLQDHVLDAIQILSNKPASETPQLSYNETVVATRTSIDMDILSPLLSELDMPLLTPEGLLQSILSERTDHDLSRDNRKYSRSIAVQLPLSYLKRCFR